MATPQQRIQEKTLLSSARMPPKQWTARNDRSTHPPEPVPQAAEPTLRHKNAVPATKRQRGVVLTAKGLQKLVDAQAIIDSFGYRYTFDALSERVCLDPRTVARIVGCAEKVDKRSLQQFFHAFGLTLEREDFTCPTPVAAVENPPFPNPSFPSAGLPNLQDAVIVLVIYDRGSTMPVDQVLINHIV